MTNGLRAILGQPVGHEFSVELGRSRNIVFALLASLSLAFLSTAATRIDWRTPLEASGPKIMPLSLAAGSMPVAANRHALAPAARDQIDALAALVAKKYRISPSVGREFIGTAFREGARTGVDPVLIVAVMAVESRFNPIAQSTAGATGLMQVIPGFHKDKLEADAGDPTFDPHANIRLGARILQAYIKRAGNEVAGLQLYNGSGDDTTNAYANKVLAERQRLLQATHGTRDRTRA